MNTHHTPQPTPSVTPHHTERSRQDLAVYRQICLPVRRAMDTCILAPGVIKRLPSVRPIRLQAPAFGSEFSLCGVHGVIVPPV